MLGPLWVIGGHVWLPEKASALKADISRAPRLTGHTHFDGIGSSCGTDVTAAQWHMKILPLYARVLGLLGPQIRLGWALALANVALAAAQFAEPVLFGRIIDSLAGAQGAGGSLSWARILPLVAPGLALAFS